MARKEPFFTFAEKRDILVNFINAFFIFLITLSTAILTDGFEWTWFGFGLACLFGLLQATYSFKQFFNNKFVLNEKKEIKPKLMSFIP